MPDKLSFLEILSSFVNFSFRHRKLIDYFPLNDLSKNLMCCNYSAVKEEYIQHLPVEWFLIWKILRLIIRHPQRKLNVNILQDFRFLNDNFIHLWMKDLFWQNMVNARILPIGQCHFWKKGALKYIDVIFHF